jgi:hypothetical protein
LEGLQFQVSSGKKLVRPHLNQKLSIVVHICNPRVSGKHKIAVQEGLGIKKEKKKQDPILKITRGEIKGLED